MSLKDEIEQRKFEIDKARAEEMARKIAAEKAQDEEDSR